MIAQMVTYNLKDFPEDEYRRACAEDLAAPIAAQPGLVSKTWIASPETNTYGGFYVWESQANIDAFARSDLFVGNCQNSGLGGQQSSDLVLPAPALRFEMAWSFAQSRAEIGVDP